MYIPKSLLDCVSKEVTRYAITNVYVDVGAKKALATNGQFLVALPIVPEPDEVSGYVPAEAIRAAAKMPKHRKGVICHTEQTTLVNGILYPNPHAENPPPFPDWQQLIPAHHATAPILACNGGFFALAAEALTPHGQKPCVTVHLDQTDPSQPLVLKSGYAEMAEAVALLMPVRDDQVTGHVCPTEETVEMWRARAVSAEALTEILQGQLDAGQGATEQIRILTEERDAARTALLTLEAQVDAAPPDLETICEDLQTQYKAMADAYATVVQQYAIIEGDYNEAMRDLTELLAEEIAPYQLTEVTACPSTQHKHI